MPYQFLFIDYETYSLINLGDKQKGKKGKHDQEEVGIRPSGLDNYAKHPSTGISMLGYAFDHEDIEQWLPQRGLPPQKLIDGMKDPSILKIAWHSIFEYNITKYVLGQRYFADPWFVPLDQLRDPIVLAHNISLPGSLEKVAKILKMAQLKDERGDELKDMFCKPVSRGGNMTLFGVAPPLFRTWESHPREFAEYCEYNKQDIRAMRDLWYYLSKIPFPDHDWQGWILDQKINEFGMPGNRDLGEKALRIAQRFHQEQKDALKKLTGVANPNSDPQMKAWVTPRGYTLNSLRANYVQNELDNPQSKLTPECRTALELRQGVKRSSYKKLQKFLSTLSADNRLRYQFRYMGAPRTGRWAGGSEDKSEGGGFQAQNMGRGEKAIKKALTHVLDLIDKENYDGLKKEFYDDVKDPKKKVSPVAAIITVLRSLFQAGPGKKFTVADLNAIENRGLGWVAGCKAILDVFRTCNDCGFLAEESPTPFCCPKCGCTKARDPYISFGTRLFNKPYAQMWAEYIAEISDDRQNSKPAVLGAGYCLGGGEMKKNEHGDMVRGGLWGYALNVCGVDMPKELAHKAVDIFRESYPEVVQLWTDLEEAFKQVLQRGGRIRVGEVTWDKKEREWVPHKTCLGCVIEFQRHKMGDGYMIRMVLPSGRALHYLNATVDQEIKTSERTGRPYTTEVLRYDGIEHSATQDANGQTAKKNHKWGRVKTYGGKLCLGGDTLVITSRGLINLDQINIDDLVWDGVNWVQHKGLIYNGLRGTSTWMGLTGTPDHQILGGNEWYELGKTSNRNGLCSLLTGLASAIRLWCFLNREKLAALGCDVTVDKSLMPTHELYEGTMLPRAPLVDANGAAQTALRDSDITSSWTQNSDNCGLGTAACGWNTLLLSRVGITQLLNLIESTTTGITSREISASSLEKKIRIIKEQLYGFLWMEKSFPTKSFANDILRIGARTLSIIISSADAPLNGVSTGTTKQRVYDLVNCGPRHQFTVMTDAGPVIVHNCENAVQAISRDILLNGMLEADQMGFHIWGLFHDELACEENDEMFGLTVNDLITCITMVPDWAPGMLLGAEGYEDRVYHK